MRYLGTMAIAFGAMLLVAAVAAQAAPVPGDPAIEDAESALHPPNLLAPEGLLADLHELEAVSTGSTAGFPADPRVPEGYSVDDPNVPAVPGATGWWIFFGTSGSTYTIDSCGSAFTAQMTVYEVKWEQPTADVKDSSTDACADPVGGEFFHPRRGGVSLMVVRIDDASGAGGDYVVNYSRTEVDLVARIRKIEVGKVKRPDGKKRKKTGRAKVAVKLYFRGEGPWKGVKCSLDGGEATDCLNRPTFEEVKSGRHEVTATVTDALGNEVTDSATFRVPRK